MTRNNATLRANLWLFGLCLLSYHGPYPSGPEARALLEARGLAPHLIRGATVT